MVTKNGVSVSLVNAETSQSFQEHISSDNKAYAEVEPDVEYFIKVENRSSNLIVALYKVDGTDLRYGKPIRMLCMRQCNFMPVSIAEFRSLMFLLR